MTNPPQKITMVYAYFENGSMLERQMQEWQTYTNKESWRIIIIDDCSKRDPAISHVKPISGMQIDLFRIETDIPWNQNGARNLGMKHTDPDDWCLMTDMDHVLTKDNANKLLHQVNRKEKAVYRFSRLRMPKMEPVKPHPNSYFLQSKMYWQVGGYDERLCGYYGTDSTLRNHLRKACRAYETINTIPLIVYGRDVIPDASTTDYGRKDSKYYIQNNREVAKLKKKNTVTEKLHLNFEWSKLEIPH